MNARADGNERRVSLADNLVQLQPRRRASMPRQQRPLYVPDDGAAFWPEDSAGWALVKFLGALDVSLILFLVISIVRR